MLLPYLNKDLIEAGCDEAGRGCLAGSFRLTFAAAPSMRLIALVTLATQFSQCMPVIFMVFSPSLVPSSLFFGISGLLPPPQQAPSPFRCLYAPFPANSIMMITTMTTIAFAMISFPPGYLCIPLQPEQPEQ